MTSDAGVTATREGQQEPLQHIPAKFRRLKKTLEENSWRVDRISGSHYIFVKPGQRCIPLAFHGGSVTRRYAELVLRQAQIKIEGDDELHGTDDITSEEIAAEMDLFQCLSIHEEINTVQDPGAFIKPIPAPKQLTQLTAGGKLQRQLQQGRETIEAKKEQQRQQEVLERVQNEIATGNYASAVAAIDKEGIDLVGSSDQNYGFSSALIFYKLVSLEECAFVEHSFNSTEQRECILDTLALSRRYMEAFCDRRQEARSLALVFQGRVIELYLEGARQALKTYCTVLLQDTPLAGKFPFLALPTDEIHPTQEFVYGQLDTMLQCLQFIILMYQLIKQQSLRPERAMENIGELDIAAMVSPCIRRMLVLFDMEKFDEVLSVANTLLFVAEHFRNGIESANFVSRPFFPASTWMTPQLVEGIAKHVMALVPAYRFAKDEMRWSRLAGVIARCTHNDTVDEIKTRFQRCQCDISNVLKFTEMWTDAIEKSQDYIQALVVSNKTRVFMFDSILDPVAVLNHTIELSARSKSIIGKIGCQFLKEFSESDCGNVCEYKMKSGFRLREFRKRKYDQMRRSVILLLAQLQKLTNIYSTYYGDLDEEGKAYVGSDDNLYYHCRFKQINSTRYHLVHLFNLLFDETSSLMVFKSIAILLCDLDVAQQFHRGVSREFRGNCESSEEIIGVGWWSFDLVYHSMMPVLLRRFVIGSEIKRLVVIDRIGGNVLAVDNDELDLAQLGLAGPTYLESTAFDLLSQILKLGDSSLSESFIRVSLNKVTVDSTKSLEYRRWVKNKSKKYAKRIGQLKKSVLEQHAKLISCMKSRETAVNILMAKLKACVVRRQDIPKDVFERIDSPSCGSREQTLLATRFSHHLHSWSYKDAEEINRSLLELQDASETATVFLHQATGLCFPMVKSISNDSWTQQEASESGELSTNALNAVADMICLRDILELANAADEVAT